MSSGGDTGAALVPGKPDESLLVDAIRYGETYQMPPKGRLPDEEVAVLVEWVKRGAPWPIESRSASGKAAGPAPFDFAERAKHWCFQPLDSAPIPTVTDGSWPRNEIDRFILAGLEARGLRPALPAEKHAWLRRVTFDLIGLPPKPAEIEDFVRDDSPEAFERVVDRLLASPHYGERQARHWLDLARFAETYGHEHDFEIPNAYPYRDYLIRAFNADLTYDQLLVEQVAATCSIHRGAIRKTGSMNRSSARRFSSSAKGDTRRSTCAKTKRRGSTIRSTSLPRPFWR